MELHTLLKQIDATRELINIKRPLAPKEIKELDVYFRIGTTYTSNALEGNTLTLTETKILLEDGLTAGIYFCNYKRPPWWKQDRWGISQLHSRV